MALPTSLTRPKPIGFSITLSSAVGPIFFEAKNTRTGEVIRADPEENKLRTSADGKGSLDASWFTTSGWQTGDKIVVSFAGKAYGSGNITLTSSTDGAQKISAITGVETALPGVNL